MKNNLRPIVIILALIAIIVYLFVTAPAPLVEHQVQHSKLIPIKEAFILIAKENDATRMLYTKAIVGAGKEQNLKFDEHWKSSEVEAGPLPALFLRSTSANLEKSKTSLGLFLGSDFPISAANKFSGQQATYFEAMKKDRQPKFFYDEGTQRHMALFPDYASVQPCVSCHNQHPESPKKDWKLGDMMGATTWSFPKDSIALDEVYKLLQAYRNGAKETYQSYLNETQSFTVNPKPQIGNKWPKQGYFLPSVAVFMDSVHQIAAAQTLNHLLKLSSSK